AVLRTVKRDEFHVRDRAKSLDDAAKLTVDAGWVRDQADPFAANQIEALGEEDVDAELHASGDGRKKAQQAQRKSPRTEVEPRRFDDRRQLKSPSLPPRSPKPARTSLLARDANDEMPPPHPPRPPARAAARDTPR